MTPIVLINQRVRAREGFSSERAPERCLVMFKQFSDVQEDRPAPLNELETRVA
jgi:hypothetical protein